MRILSLLILSSFFISTTKAQVVTESLISLTRVYDPLFDSKSASLSIDFVRTFEIGEPDTIKSVIIQVSNSSMELESSSIGVSALGFGGLFGGKVNSGSTFRAIRNKDQVILGYDGYMDFYDAFNKVYVYVGSYASQRKAKRNFIASVDFESMTIGGEFNPRSSIKVKFFFKLSEGVIFELTKEEFDEMAGTLRTIKQFWTPNRS